MKTRFILILCFFLFCFAGCDNSGIKKDEVLKKYEASVMQDDFDGQVKLDTSEKDFKPFYIYSNKGSRDNHYVPSGFMPNGNCIDFNDKWTEDCHSGSTCIKIVYDVECSRGDMKWAGIYWLNPANNWGQKKGGYDLTGARKLTFWAKGKVGGEQISEVTVGGLKGPYPDSDLAVIGPVILTLEWKRYTIDLRGKDLRCISGGFSWTTSEDVNYGDCEFFLDDIRFE